MVCQIKTNKYFIKKMITNKDVEFLLRIFLLKNKIYEDFKNELKQRSFYGDVNTIKPLCKFFFDKKVYLGIINSFKWDTKKHNGSYWLGWNEKYDRIIQKLLNEGKLTSNCKEFYPL